MTTNVVLKMRFVHACLLLDVIYSSWVLPAMRLWPPIMCITPYTSFSQFSFYVLFDVDNKLYLNPGI